MESVEELIGMVESAFAEVPPPDCNDKISNPNCACGECGRLRDAFRGRDWREVATDADTIDNHYPCLMSPRAFHYYVPAYLISFLLDEEEYDIPDMIIGSIENVPYLGNELTQAQKIAIEACNQLAQQREIEYG
jgi:hypothetical protein